MLLSSFAAYTINILEIPLKMPSGNSRTISVIFTPNFWFYNLVSLSFFKYFI